MRRKLFVYIVFFVACLPVFSVNNVISAFKSERAEITLQAIYKNYLVENNCLLREIFPFNELLEVTYLVDNEQNAKKNTFAYLWPYSGSLSAVSALYENGKDLKYLQLLENKVLPGLDMYYDTRRLPYAYASYINTVQKSDRYYDDNIWIGLDFTDLYLSTGNKKYLDKAIAIWKFIESGTDMVIGGGIYWCEQKKESKNTCSNAPGAVLALKLFKATKDSSYFYKGKTLYEWTKDKLQDRNDFLYYDNINLKEHIGRTKFAYNSGQMLQAAALMYEITKNETFLNEAQNIASSCYDYFFYNFEADNGEQFKIIKKGNIWFTAIMLRGFEELYKLDGNKKYICAFQQNLDYAWEHMRENNGLFNSDWSGNEIDDSKWLLTQFAMVEMYSRLDNL